MPDRRPIGLDRSRGEHAVGRQRGRRLEAEPGEQQRVGQERGQLGQVAPAALAQVARAPRSRPRPARSRAPSARRRAPPRRRARRPARRCASTASSSAAHARARRAAARRRTTRPSSSAGRSSTPDAGRVGQPPAGAARPGGEQVGVGGRDQQPPVTSERSRALPVDERQAGRRAARSAASSAAVSRWSATRSPSASSCRSRRAANAGVGRRHEAPPGDRRDLAQERAAELVVLQRRRARSCPRPTRPGTRRGTARRRRPSRRRGGSRSRAPARRRPTRTGARAPCRRRSGRSPAAARARRPRRRRSRPRRRSCAASIW